MDKLSTLLTDVRACTLCKDSLPLGPRPVVQAHHESRILIAGQAPGRKVHESGVPFDDASGDRLRDWLGVTTKQFYDPKLFALLPMGFCFPGTGPSGDLPPRPECAPAWRAPLLKLLPNIRVTLLIGQYAQRWSYSKRMSVTERVSNWQEHFPEQIPLPHPSPRNQIWLRRNPWFTEQLLPELKTVINSLLK